MFEVPNVAPCGHGFAGISFQFLVGQLAEWRSSKSRGVFGADATIASREVVAESTVGKRRVEIVDCVMHGARQSDNGGGNGAAAKKL